tara:strand:+ start:99 stop:221 length:123 start_codon:yes stop_codon:yes gene_type:complete
MTSTVLADSRLSEHVVELKKARAASIIDESTSLLIVEAPS